MISSYINTYAVKSTPLRLKKEFVNIWAKILLSEGGQTFFFFWGGGIFLTVDFCNGLQLFYKAIFIFKKSYFSVITAPAITFTPRLQLRFRWNSPPYLYIHHTRIRYTSYTLYTLYVNNIYLIHTSCVRNIYVLYFINAYNLSYTHIINIFQKLYMIYVYNLVL